MKKITCRNVLVVVREFSWINFDLLLAVGEIVAYADVWVGDYFDSVYKNKKYSWSRVIGGKSFSFVLT